jgi:hypothetical protein
MASRGNRSVWVARWLSVSLTACAVGLAIASSAFGQTSPGRVLILDGTVSGGATSIEATKAASLGFSVDIVTPAQWSTFTSADFARYRAIILGDPSCVVGTSPIAAAIANAQVWEPVVNGNVVLVGTDPAFHWQFRSTAAAKLLSDNAVTQATALQGATGAYISLSCYYVGAPPNTPLSLLDGFSPGGFTVESGQEHDVAHITAPSSPTLAGLTDATLSGWMASIHEVIDKWPSDFEVLAVDPALGKPYILSRGPTRPTSKGQCKNGGWKAYRVFKNQGDCVSFVATNGENQPSGH